MAKGTKPVAKVPMAGGQGAVSGGTEGIPSAPSSEHWEDAEGHRGVGTGKGLDTGTGMGLEGQDWWPKGQNQWPKC